MRRFYFKPECQRRFYLQLDRAKWVYFNCAKPIHRQCIDCRFGYLYSCGHGRKWLPGDNNDKRNHQYITNAISGQQYATVYRFNFKSYSRRRC